MHPGETASPVRVESLVDAAAARAPAHSALIYGDHVWTYAALRAEMDRRAALLLGYGLHPGDVVATTEPVTDDVAIAFLACCRADLTYFPLAASLTDAEIAPLLCRARVKAILTADGRAHPACRDVPALPITLPGIPDTASRQALADAANADVAAIAAIQTTSSTTGSAPKLVPTPHRMYTWKRNTPAWWERPSDVHMIALGAFSPARNLCEVIAQAATAVYPQTMAPARLEAEMALHGVTAIRTVPPVVRMLVGQRRPPPALAIRIVRFGSAPLAQEAQCAAAQRYGATIVQTYSSTEGDSIMVTQETGPEGTIGKPLPDVDVRIVDEAGSDVPDGAVGELIIRSPGIMYGYLDDPAATALALRNGWLWTGDLGRRDADGFYFLVGRRASHINVGGLKVSPEEVETVLARYPGVREAIVLAAPDAARGEVVRAVIVPADRPPAIPDLRRFCLAHLAPYKVPRVWDFRDDLPRSPLGKPLRNRL